MNFIRVISLINIILSIFFLVNYNVFLASHSDVVFLYSIFISIILSHQVFNNRFLWMVQITFIYYLYSAYIQMYFVDPLKTPLPYQTTMSLYKAAFFILSFFSIGLLLLNNNYRQYTKVEIYKPYIQWWPIFLSITIILLICFFDRGTIGNQYEVKNNPIFEYGFILFIFLFLSSNTKLRIWISRILVFVYIYEDIHYGGRISSLQVILVFIYFLNWNKISACKFIFTCLAGIILFGFVSAYRTSYSTTGLSLTNVLYSLYENKFALDSAANSFYSSLVAIAFENKNINNYNVESFFNFISSSTIWIEMFDIPSLAEYLNRHGGNNLGGNWFIGYMNLWGGCFLSMFLFFLMWTAIFRLSQCRYMLGKICFIAVLASSPRWFLYSPNTFCKVIILVFVLYKITLLFKQYNGFSKHNCSDL